MGITREIQPFSSFSWFTKEDVSRLPLASVIPASSQFAALCSTLAADSCRLGLWLLQGCNHQNVRNLQKKGSYHAKEFEIWKHKGFQPVPNIAYICQCLLSIQSIQSACLAWSLSASSTTFLKSWLGLAKRTLWELELLANSVSRVAAALVETIWDNVLICLDCQSPRGILQISLYSETSLASLPEEKETMWNSNTDYDESLATHLRNLINLNGM